MSESSLPESFVRLVEAAKNQIALIERGDTTAALNAIEMAATSLTGIVNGQQPDAEQLVYLAFLASALKEIANGVTPAKALGLFGNKRIANDRDMTLFLLVGGELDLIARKSNETQRPVAAAIAAVAQRTGLGKATVSAAWKSFGGEDAWLSAKDI